LTLVQTAADVPGYPARTATTANLHSVALIDAATKSAETVPAGDLPRHLHISGDGTRAYVTDLRHNCVWVLDPVNKAIITTVDLGRKPEVLALSADERFLYTADHRAPTLSVVSLASSEGRPNPRR
jgi:YVTN family beta-propeller protein